EARDDVMLGLLTGNVVHGARAKLAAAGIDPDRFVVGAYGSDHETRSALPTIARQRVFDEHGHELTGHDIVIIGDTPADVQCGQSLGVRAIGVATGHFTVEDLRECGAYAVFEDLSDTAAVVAAILEPG
ncbi:MAG TPA: HAD hydrolase-like protein, partial [Gemmatimonadaceae bacterium]|nr:HAD hydrolase-like protein [Gemmatimonadaceae bacterium]